MLAKIPSQNSKSPFKNKFTILSVLVLIGLGLSAAYVVVPFIQAPTIHAPTKLVGNTTQTTLSSPANQNNAPVTINNGATNTTASNTTSINDNSAINNNKNTTSTKNSNKSNTSTKSNTSSNSNTNSKSSNSNST